MEILIVIISILVLTLAVWLVRKYFSVDVCPVCAGVSLTWLWLIVGIVIGQLPADRWELLAAILMGGTVVGLMQKLEKFIKVESILTWKTGHVTSGFLAVYGLLNNNWFLFAIGGGLLIAIFVFFKDRQTDKGKTESNTTKKLEKEMEKCC